MKNYFFRHWPFFIIFVLSFLTTWPLFLPGYFSHHDDLQIMRIFEMRKCFLDLQIPCRWVPDMGYGNGFPLFNYYGVFPYYLGAFLSFLGGYIWAAKVLFFIPLVLGGVSMYFLGKELFGKLTGFISGVLYLFAPYRALDAYVRGAISESFALAIAPLLFYFFLRLIKEKTYKNFLAATFSLGLFLTIHNIMTLLFLPVLFIWIIGWSVKEKYQNFLPLVFSLLLGFGLAAYFVLPAFFEKSLVQTETLTRFDLDFRTHFVTIKQLFFDHSFGYGASILGPNDNISFQIGWPHWWLVGITVCLWGINLMRKRKIQFLIPFWFSVFLFSIFMTHNKSSFIWEKIGILRFAQFPWRFLSLSIFSASLLGGFLINFLARKDLAKIIIIIVAMITVFLNWNYFKPEYFYSLEDKGKLKGKLWEIQQKAAILDYLPKTAYEPREPAPQNPIIVAGEAKVENFVNKSNRWSFKVDVFKEANVEVPVFDFPNWQVYVNGKKFPHSHNNFLGRIRLDLALGSYEIKGKLSNTSIRTFSNTISLFSWVIFLGITIYGKTKKTF